MIALWMLYCVVVSLLLGGTAAATERCLRLFRKPARWSWGIALIGSVGLPVVALWAPTLLPATALESQLEGGLGEAAATMWQAPAAAMGAAGSWLESLDRVLVTGWIAATLFLLTLYAWSAWRLTREVRELPPTQFDGVSVLVSEDMGPAVFGLLRSSIVLPSWVLSLDRDLRGMISLHEREHVRANDQPLLLAALSILLFLPWNIAIWWQYRRLRLAVEADCDLRVLRRGIDARTYGTFLLEIEKRANRSKIPVLALARGESSLAKRIHLMTWKPRKKISHAFGAAAIATVLGVLACETPVPNEPALLEESRVLATPENNEPLYVIDGVIINSLSELEVDLESLDITEIEVIKGAAAEALYGERATNGLIRIMTRSNTDATTEQQSLHLRPSETLRLTGERIEWLPFVGRAVDLGQPDTLFLSPTATLLAGDPLDLSSPRETTVVVRIDTSGVN